MNILPLFSDISISAAHSISSKNGLKLIKKLNKQWQKTFKDYIVCNNLNPNICIYSSSINTDIEFEKYFILIV